MRLTSKIWVVLSLTAVFMSNFCRSDLGHLGGGDDGDSGRRSNIRIGEDGTDSDDFEVPPEDYFLSAGQDENDKQKQANRSPSASDLLVPSPEERLYKYLFGRGYVKNVRPSMDPNKPVTVRVGMCVMMIEDLIEREQMMIMAACVKMLWDDHRLTWDPTKYQNLTWIAVSNQIVWFPDIVIVNSPDPAALTRKVTNVGLSHKGELGFFPSGRLFTRCNLVITYFPFDWQQCEVRFESWIYPTQYLELDLYPGDDTIDVKEHYANYQWNIRGHRIQSEIVTYDGQNFSSITITFIFRRKSLYFSLYFIFPELLLAVLQTLSHTLPVEHPGRMTMLTALFIGTSVTHAGVAAHIPKSSDTMSLLQVYMTIMSVNLVFSLLITFLMLYTVLRYPNAEPSFKSMVIAFFSVVWPKLKEKYAGGGENEIKELPGSTLHHYIYRQTPQLPEIDVDSLKFCEQHSSKQQNGNVVANGHYGTPKSDTLVRKLTHPDQIGAPSRKKIPNSATVEGIAGAVITRPNTLAPKIPTQSNFAPGGNVFGGSSHSSSSFDRRRGSTMWDADFGMNSSYVSKQRCITAAPVSMLMGNGGGEHHVTATALLKSNGGVITHKTAAAATSSSAMLIVEEHSDVEETQNSDFLSSGQQSPSGNKIRRRLSSTMSKSAYHMPAARPSLAQSEGGASAKPMTKEEQRKARDAAEQEAQELKRRWLIYCVALDKTIMYCTGALNVVVPAVLFMMVPVANELFFMSHNNYEVYQQ